MTQRTVINRLFKLLGKQAHQITLYNGVDVTDSKITLREGRLTVIYDNKIVPLTEIEAVR